MSGPPSSRPKAPDLFQTHHSLNFAVAKPLTIDRAGLPRPGVVEAKVFLVV